ncbi:hypothetical protein Trihar35433_1749 [Trichoderma harzianum]|nr:hypothetical protein Trihar35433_1749 [Trichoderma harzianum]
MTILPASTATWVPHQGIWSPSPLDEMPNPIDYDRGAELNFAAPHNSFPGPSSRSASFPTPMSPPQRIPFHHAQAPHHPSDVGAATFFDYEPPVAPTPVRVLIRCLPATTSEADLRLMLVFSQELVKIEFMGSDNYEGVHYRSAVVVFRSMHGAIEVRNMLDGRANGRAKLMVSILPSPDYGSPDYGSPVSAPFAMPNGAPNASADIFTAPVYRPQPAPIGNGFPPRDAMSPTSKAGRFFPAAPPHQDLAAPDTKAGSHYKNIFNAHSPIGNHLANEASGRLGKHLINDELGDDDDGELLRDSFAYAGKATPAQRRGTTPQDPISQAMANLALNSGASSTPSPMPASYLGVLAHVNGSVNGNGNGNYMSLGQQLQQQQRHQLSQLPQQNPQQQSLPQHNKQQQQQQQPRAQPQQDKQDKQQQQQLPYGKPNFPPVNPADQNPPCNTLYVGNLPIDTSEEELKALFSPVRGYKRLCFRTKQNGPMCFVEFEDIGHATKALSQLYGWCLHNSVKGGIRLSFSKNPLGVRSPPSQATHGNLPPVNGIAPSTANGFTAASGPPPGLPKPTNFGNRAYTSYTPNSRGSNSGTPINGSSAGSNFQRAPFYKNGINMAKPHTPFA